MRSIRCAAAIFVLCVTAWAGTAEAKPSVSFELGTEPGFPITGAKEWYDLLTELGVSGLSIHSATEQDGVSVETVGRKEAPSYKVKGILKANNVLYLPGGKFALRDRAGIKQWLDNLIDQGIPGVAEQRTAFGLLPAQLLDVTNDLTPAVTSSTAGKSAAEVVAACGKHLKYPLALDPGAAGELAKVKIAEELQGLSIGTALAVAVRPAGLVLEPRRPPGGQIQYRIGKSVSGREGWPCGWKPQGINSKFFPERFEMIEVEMNATPLEEALAAIGERLKVPMLFDHNALALHGIDPSKVEVTLPAKKLSYSLIIQKALSKAHLKAEVRQDEAGKPLYWITTVKPAG
jgi:hypothetical protein